jgi:hypothetical protein
MGLTKPLKGLGGMGKNYKKNLLMKKHLVFEQITAVRLITRKHEESNRAK